MRWLDRVPLFWRLQILGWTVVAVGTFPAKLVVFHSVSAALAITVLRDPVGLLLSTLMRFGYRRLTRRERRSWQIGLVILAVAGGAAALDVYVARFVTTQVHGPEESVFHLGVFLIRFGLYTVWSLLYFGIKAQRAHQERELNVARAETARREAELQLLRAQVNPHFLFNALNTILATLETDEPRPRRIVEGLAAYLRYSLSHRHDTTVALGAEYDAALNYLAVEQERFRGELIADCTIDDEARDLPVPGVLIQPLLENAIKYARATAEPPYRVKLRVQSPQSGEVDIEVANAGHWVEPSSSPGPHGTGLENLRRRLSLLYPNRHRLETRDDNGWVTVRIQLRAVPSAPGTLQPVA